MEQQIINNYSEAIHAIKNAILKSRYRAAVSVNKELLSLYYGIGRYISENSRQGFWGTNALETISQRLQQEVPGLRGFSVSNLKNMRAFYEGWSKYITDLDDNSNRQFATGDLKNIAQINIDELLANR